MAKSRRRKTATRGRTKSAVQHLSSVPRHLSSVSWQAPDFHFHPHGLGWSLLLIFTGVLLGSFFAMVGQYWLAVILALSGIVLALGAKDKPSLLNFAVTEHGLAVNQRLLPWNEHKSFWLVAAPEGNKLYLEKAGRGSPVHTFYLGQADPDKVRGALARHLPEHVTRGEHLRDVLARLLRV